MTNKYGVAAVLAANASHINDPVRQWTVAVEQVFPSQLASQKKGCPRGAFLGLCEEGRIKGIPRGHYTSSIDNKAYALRALHLLESGFEPATSDALWKGVMNGVKKVHNSQASVVLELWCHGLIDCGK